MFVWPTEIIAVLAHDETCCMCRCIHSNRFWLTVSLVTSGLQIFFFFFSQIFQWLGQTGAQHQRRCEKSFQSWPHYCGYSCEKYFKRLPEWEKLLSVCFQLLSDRDVRQECSIRCHSALHQTTSWSHPELLGQISAHTSLVIVTAKNPHTPAVTEVTEAAGPDKVLPVLSHHPLLLPHSLFPWPPFPPHSPSISQLFPLFSRELSNANWSGGFRCQRGWQHNHTSNQTEPTLIQQRRNSQPSFGTLRGLK